MIKSYKKKPVVIEKLKEKWLRFSHYYGRPDFYWFIIMCVLFNLYLGVVFYVLL